MKKMNRDQINHSGVGFGKNFFGTICTFAFMTLTCFLFILASSFFLSSQNKQKTSLFSLSDSSILRDQAGKMFSVEQEAENPISFALWRQNQNQLAENTDLKKSKANLTVLEVTGSAWQVVLGENMELDESDNVGCFISSDIAFSLFGDRDVIGKKINWDGHGFEIRGILNDHTNVMAIRAVDVRFTNAGDDAGIENAGSTFSFLYADDRFNMLGFSRVLSDEEMSSFNSRHSINPITLNSSFFSAANYLSTNLLSLFILFFCCFLFVRKANQEKTRPVLRMLLFLGAIFIFVGLWILLQLGFQPDSRFFPTEIADFSFWGNLFNTLGKEISQLFSHFSMIPVQNMFLEMGKCFMTGLAVCALGLSLQCLVQIDSETKLFGYSILSLLATFVAFGIANNTGIRIQYLSAVFLLFPLLFLRKYMLLQFDFIPKINLQGTEIAQEAEIRRVGLT